MASDPDAITRQSREAYKGFCRLLGYSTAAVVVVLLAMALFLL